MGRRAVPWSIWMSANISAMAAKKGGARRYGNPANRVPVSGDLAKLVQPTGNSDPRTLGGGMSGPGGSRNQGAVLLDVTDVVLLNSIDVCTVDVARRGELTAQRIYMTLGGRVNRRADVATVGFVFGTDGAAVLITQLLALADRFGVEMLTDIASRLVDLGRGGHVDLHFLRAAIDSAIEAGEA